MACNISLDCNNVQPRSAFCFAVSSCPDSSSGTLHCIIDLSQPIPKRSRCRGHIVISWMFTSVVKQALFAKISSIFIEVLRENWNWQLKNSSLSVTQADEAKKKIRKQLHGVGYIGVRSDKHCRHPSDDTRDWTFNLLTFVHFKFYMKTVSPF